MKEMELAAFSPFTLVQYVGFEDVTLSRNISEGIAKGVSVNSE